MADPVQFFDAIQATVDRIDATASPQRFPVVRTKHTDTRAEIDKSTRRAVHMRDRWMCQWCGRHWTQTRLEVDHITPWSAGGSDDMSNLRTLCSDCNLRRSNYDMDTEQRRPPISDCCLSCHPDRSWDDMCETGRVFCINCRFVGLGPRWDLA